MAQERVAIADLEKILNDLAGWNTLLKKLI
jgi:glycyl-tRNA synthetase